MSESVLGNHMRVFRAEKGLTQEKLAELAGVTAPSNLQGQSLVPLLKDPNAQGRGWAHAAVRACIDGLLLPLGMTRLRGITDVRNAASLRLLSRLGFMQTSSEDIVFRGEACTEITLEKRL